MKSSEALKASAEGAARVRSKDRLDGNAALLEWLNINCHGMTLAVAAEKYAANLGIKANAAKQRIHRAGIRKEGAEWVLRVSDS